jgi:hypothetical protein
MYIHCVLEYLFSIWIICLSAIVWQLHGSSALSPCSQWHLLQYVLCTVTTILMAVHSKLSCYDGDDCFFTVIDCFLL